MGRLIFLYILTISNLYAEDFKLDYLHKSEMATSLSQAKFHVLNFATNEDFKFKGNYNIISGKWSAIETAWHSSQFAQGLLEYYLVFETPIHTAIDFLIINQFPINHNDKKMAGSNFEIRQKKYQSCKTRLLIRDNSTAFDISFLSQVYKANFTGE